MGDVEDAHLWIGLQHHALADGDCIVGDTEVGHKHESMTGSFSCSRLGHRRRQRAHQQQTNRKNSCIPVHSEIYLNKNAARRERRLELLFDYFCFKLDSAPSCVEGYTS